MSSVLFIIQIPTKVEEQRLKQLKMERKDANDDGGGGSGSGSVQKDGTSINPTKATTSITENYESEQDYLTEDSATQNEDSPSTKGKRNQKDIAYRSQYDTFPKRKKSQNQYQAKLFANDSSGANDKFLNVKDNRAQTENSGGSLKDINRNVSSNDRHRIST